MQPHYQVREGFDHDSLPPSKPLVNTTTPRHASRRSSLDGLRLGEEPRRRRQGRAGAGGRPLLAKIPHQDLFIALVPGQDHASLFLAPILWDFLGLW